MEGLMNKRVDKRVYEQSVEDGNGSMPQQKKPKLPALASVVVEALKVDTLQRFCSSLEPLLRRIVSEEVERALEKLVDGKLDGRSSPPRLQGPEGKTLQLHFRTRMPPHLFTGGKVEGERGASIDIVLLDLDTGNVMQSGPESAAKLSVVVLKGDFNEEDNDDWTAELFESHEVKEREGKRPLLTGDLQVSLEQGVGTLGDLTFTDNSSWIRSRKFRLGVKVAAGYCEGIRIREAKTEGFAVKDHRGELYKKHYPPLLHDEVWRLDRIAKDGALHKKLMKAEIVTVEDFLRLFVRDQQRLRNILGSGMSNRMWENTVEHAKTCVLGGKLYVYYTDDAHGSGAVFSHIYELRGIIADGNFFPLESLSHDQKVSVDFLVKRAYENWGRVVEYDGTVLNFAAARSNGGTETSAVAAADENHVDDQYSMQSPEQDRYISSDLSLHYENENSQQIHQLIEFPFMRAETTDANAMVSTYLSEDCYQQRDEHEMDDFFSEEIIRSRSSQMLESDDMQRLLKTVGFSALGHSTEASYYHSVPYEPPMDGLMAKKQCQSSGKAVVGWLKLKAALRWGIFVRKKAAERRAQLIELD